MDQATDRTAVLLEFFKALADEKRLQIVGLLARQEYSVEELATILGLSSATVSRHLQRLVQADLVEARAGQPHHVYSLKLQTLHTMSQKVLSRDTWNGTVEGMDLDSYDTKVLRSCVVDGRLKVIPSQWKKRDVILRYLAEKFEPGRRYSEREVNAILSRTHEDYASLRRYLVDSQYLAREKDVYWRPESES
jgi:predicted transcriptional regulator